MGLLIREDGKETECSSTGRISEPFDFSSSAILLGITGLVAYTISKLSSGKLIVIVTAAGIWGFIGTLMVLTIRLRRFGLIIRVIAIHTVGGGGRHVSDPFPTHLLLPGHDCRSDQCILPAAQRLGCGGSGSGGRQYRGHREATA